MKEILLYTLLPYLSNFKEIGMLAVWVLLGVIASNRFNDGREKDVKGTDLLVVVLLIASLIHFGLKKIPWEEPKNFTAIILGLGNKKLIKKWLKMKIWDKYDFVAKKGR